MIERCTRSVKQLPCNDPASTGDSSSIEVMSPETCETTKVCDMSFDVQTYAYRDSSNEFPLIVVDFTHDKMCS